MNRNQIVTDAFSSPESKKMYEEGWPAEPTLKRQAAELCQQCGGCSFYAEFNTDWGLCSHPESRHHLETVWEHFTCGSYVDECWGPHSFSEDKECHCKCGGGTALEACWSVLTYFMDCSGTDEAGILHHISDFLSRGQRLRHVLEILREHPGGRGGRVEQTEEEDVEQPLAADPGGDPDAGSE